MWHDKGTKRRDEMWFGVWPLGGHQPPHPRNPELLLLLGHPCCKTRESDISAVFPTMNKMPRKHRTCRIFACWQTSTEQLVSPFFPPQILSQNQPKPDKPIIQRHLCIDPYSHCISRSPGRHGESKTLLALVPRQQHRPPWTQRCSAARPFLPPQCSVPYIGWLCVLLRVADRPSRTGGLRWTRELFCFSSTLGQAPCIRHIFIRSYWASRDLDLLQ